MTADGRKMPLPTTYRKNVPLAALILLASASVDAQEGHSAGPVVDGPFFAPFESSGEPQTFHQRFMDYSIAAFGPQTLFIPPFWATLRMADPPKGYPHDWRAGKGAFGRNLGNAFAWRTSLESARFATAALLHEDFRYRRSTSRNPLVRTFHALAFTVVDKSDSGGNRIALSNFAAAAASGFVGDLYLPDGFNDRIHGENRMAIAFAGLMAKNLLREFMPERLKSARGWQAILYRHPVPEWWSKTAGASTLARNP